jgi:hypothetical protein
VERRHLEVPLRAASWFFGDFRDVRAYGNRARLLYQTGGTIANTYDYDGHRLSRWTLKN